jgi:hypothetical protein
LQKVLTKDAPPHNVEYIEKEDSDVRKQENKQVQKDQPQKGKTEGSSVALEKILTEAIRSPQPISKEVQSVVQEQAFDNKNTEFQEDDEHEDKNGSHVSTQSDFTNQKPDSQGWLLTSPAAMYNYFYTQKASLITNITRNGSQLPFDKLLDELRSSYVNTSVEMSDLQGMYDKLSQIQNYLDRVVQIKILATGQCSATKRGVELLRGVLAKVCYEKPAARQDGVNYDHMRDIEMYACQVESLEQCAKDVYHNLLEAKEILSRKISVAIELFKQQHMGDNIEKSFNNLPGNVKQAIHAAEKVENISVSAKDGFDKLEVQETVFGKGKVEKTPNKKVGQIDWNDI